MTTRISIAFALAAFAALGCGGKNTASDISGATVPVAGETNQATGTNVVTVTGPAVTNVTVGGATQTGVVGEGVVVGAGDPIAFFPAGSGFIGAVFAVDTEIFLNGKPTGVFLSATDGKLKQNLIVPAGPCVFVLHGAAIHGGPRNAVLGPVDDLIIRGTVFADGSSSIPLRIAGVVPGNGETTQGARIELTMDPATNGMTVELRVVHANGIVQKVANVIGGVAQISEINAEGFIDDATTLELAVR